MNKKQAWEIAEDLIKSNGIETSAEFKELRDKEIRGEISTGDMIKTLTEKYEIAQDAYDDELWTISSNLDRNRYIKSLKDAKGLIQRRAEVFCYYDDADYLRIVDILDKEIQYQQQKKKY